MTYSILNLLTQPREKIYLSINTLGQRRTFPDYDGYAVTTEDPTYVLMDILLEHYLSGYNKDFNDDDRLLIRELSWIISQAHARSCVDCIFICSLLNEEHATFWSIVRRYATTLLSKMPYTYSYQEFNFTHLLLDHRVIYRDIPSDTPLLNPLIAQTPPASTLSMAMEEFNALRKIDSQPYEYYLWEDFQNIIKEINPQIMDIYMWLRQVRIKKLMINPKLRFLSPDEIVYFVENQKDFYQHEINFYPILIQNQNIIGEFIMDVSIYNKNVIMYDPITKKFSVISTDISDYVVNLLRFWLVKYPTLQSLEEKFEYIEQKIDIPIGNLFIKNNIL